MKYLNEQSTQFTRVGDDHARSLMEQLGYTLPPQSRIVSEVYVCEETQYQLGEEVIEGADNQLYVSIEAVGGSDVVNVDESGRTQTISEVTFDDQDYVLEGVYENEDNAKTYARMVFEGEEAEEAEEAEEVEDADEDVEADEESEEE